MNKIDKLLAEHRVLPIVVIDDADLAEPLCHAVLGAGLPLLEFTLRTPAALRAIQTAAGIEGLCVGAGTVLSIEQVQRAVEAGAQYIVTPGLNPELVTFCLEQKIPVYPGVATPTEMDAALRLGVSTVKYFPAESLGGIKALKAMAAPFPDLTFVPTGGIRSSSLSDYLAFDRVLACGGSWMVSRELLAGRCFDEILTCTQEALQIARDCSHPTDT